jgi:threonine dehydratase
MANPGYTFLSWKENGVEVSTEAEYQFKANPVRHLVASFGGGGGISWNVSVGAASTGGGTVSGGGFRADGAAVMVRAVAAEGFQFVKWLEDGVEVSRAAEYAFEVTSDRVLTAVFVPVLGVESESGGRMRLTWAADATGWVLEENDGVDVAGWRPSGAAVVPTADGLTALVELVGPRRFYRLSHP